MKIAGPALAAVVVLALGACGGSDEEPAVSEASETTEPTSETPTESETPVEPVTPTESTAAAGSGPIVLEDGRIDLCSVVDLDDLAAETGWTPLSSGDYVGEGSCEWEFQEAELSVGYDEYRSFDQVREQSQNFEVVELDGVGDGAFLQLAMPGLEIRPESVGLVVSSGEWVLVGGSVEVDESVSQDELAAAAEALGRACAAAL